MNYRFRRSLAVRGSKVLFLQLFAATACACLLVTGCSKGGGDNGGDNDRPPTGSIAATVVDEFGTPVDGASVSVASGSTAWAGTTDSGGVATVTDVPTGNAFVTVTATGFEDFTDSVSVSENAEAPISVTLTRQTEPAAGSFSAQLTESVGLTDRETVTFSVDVVVVDSAPNAVISIETLTAADFSLNACSDDDPDVAECLIGDRTQPDIGYTVVRMTPDPFELLPGAPAKTYAANLMIDQSGSIEDGDPSDARLFATKAFLQNLGASDFASVSAFAMSGSEPALIPTEPVTRITGFIQSEAAEDFFEDIDELAQLEGGDTPLLDSIDQELDYVVANAPASVERSAIVVFTDGINSGCKELSCNDPITAKAVSLGVNLFTIGLGSDVNAGALTRLAYDSGGFFLFAQNAEQLFPIYRSLGNLLSGSLSTYRMEWTIQADEPNTYEIGQTILGTLVVTTPQNQIDLPIWVLISD